MAQAADQPIVFINIGWMVNYSGASSNDPTLGNFGYLRTDTVGHEAWNFKPLRGKVYGYVPRSAKIKLERLGAPKGSDVLSPVTVVWMARSPRDKKTYIVGWYKDATLHRNSDAVRLSRAKSFEVAYQVEAPAGSATLLPPDARVFTIPTAKVPGNLGQSPVWYGRDEEFRSAVRAFIGGKKVLPGKKIKGSPRQQDPDLRRKIEKAAILHATRHYTSAKGGNRDVISVEALSRGWDLEATAFDLNMLKVEVKGLSGKQLVVELTPNEYAKMMAPEHRKDYVVYIVTEALESSATGHIFKYNAELSIGRDHVWITDDDRRLTIEKRIAARLSCDALVDIGAE